MDIEETQVNIMVSKNQPTNIFHGLCEIIQFNSARQLMGLHSHEIWQHLRTTDGGELVPSVECVILQLDSRGLHLYQIGISKLRKAKRRRVKWITTPVGNFLWKSLYLFEKNWCGDARTTGAPTLAAAMVFDRRDTAPSSLVINWENQTTCFLSSALQHNS